MFERLRGLVPFVERGQGEEIKAKQMLSKVMEFCAAGGFHCRFPEDGSEYFAVNSLSGDERFSALIRNYSGLGDEKENRCSITRFNPNGSIDVLVLSLTRMSIGEDLLFRTEHNRFGTTSQLKEKEWRKILESFLNSSVDHGATRLLFEDIEADDTQFIKSGQTILRWVNDMDRSSLIYGLLKDA